MRNSPWINLDRLPLETVDCGFTIAGGHFPEQHQKQLRTATFFERVLQVSEKHIEVDCLNPEISKLFVVMIFSSKNLWKTQPKAAPHIPTSRNATVSLETLARPLGSQLLDLYPGEFWNFMCYNKMCWTHGLLWFIMFEKIKEVNLTHHKPMF